MGKLIETFAIIAFLIIIFYIGRIYQRISDTTPATIYLWKIEKKCSSDYSEEDDKYKSCISSLMMEYEYSH
jgi:hypothetical protein